MGAQSIGESFQFIALFFENNECIIKTAHVDENVNW